jgi:hypothetical protein
LGDSEELTLGATGDCFGLLVLVDSPPGHSIMEQQTARLSIRVSVSELNVD